MPLVELAYLRGNSSEINNAIVYLSKFDSLEITDKLENKINDYFKLLDKKSKGLYHNYIHYYFKHGSNNHAKSLLLDEVSDALDKLEPNTITRSQYISFDISNASLFNLLSKHVNEINLSADISLKFPIIMW